MLCSYVTIIIVILLSLQLDNIKFASPEKMTQRSKSLENNNVEEDSKYSRDQTSEHLKETFINSNLSETNTVFPISYSRNGEKIVSRWENIKELISQLKVRADEIEVSLKKLRNNKGIGNVYEARPLVDRRYHAKKWDHWTDWSPCSVSCGSGRQVRWRKCLNEQCSIAEAEMEEKLCQLPECPRKFLGIF